MAHPATSGARKVSHRLRKPLYDIGEPGAGIIPMASPSERFGGFTVEATRA